jgi:hypothetical protein
MSNHTLVVASAASPIGEALPCKTFRALVDIIGWIRALRTAVVPESPQAWECDVNPTAKRAAAMWAAALVIAGLASLLLGCGKKAAPAAPPPPQVSVLTVQPQTIPAVYDWVAQAAASKSVQVRSQVSGVIVERP